VKNVLVAEGKHTKGSVEIFVVVVDCFRSGEIFVAA